MPPFVNVVSPLRRRRRAFAISTWSRRLRDRLPTFSPITSPAFFFLPLVTHVVSPPGPTMFASVRRRPGCTRRHFSLVPASSIPLSLVFFPLPLYEIKVDGIIFQSAVSPASPFLFSLFAATLFSLTSFLSYLPPQELGLSFPRAERVRPSDVGVFFL